MGRQGRDSRGLRWGGRIGCDRGQHVGVVRDHRRAGPGSAGGDVVASPHSSASRLSSTSIEPAEAQSRRAVHLTVVPPGPEHRLRPATGPTATQLINRIIPKQRVQGEHRLTLHRADPTRSAPPGRTRSPRTSGNIGHRGSWLVWYPEGPLRITGPTLAPSVMLRSGSAAAGAAAVSCS